MTSVIPKSEAACFKTQKGWSQLRPAFIVATTRTSQPVMCDRYLIPRLGGHCCADCAGTIYVWPKTKSLVLFVVANSQATLSLFIIFR